MYSLVMQRGKSEGANGKKEGKKREKGKEKKTQVRKAQGGKLLFSTNYEWSTTSPASNGSHFACFFPFLHNTTHLGKGVAIEPEAFRRKVLSTGDTSQVSLDCLLSHSGTHFSVFCLFLRFFARIASDMV